MAVAVEMMEGIGGDKGGDGGGGGDGGDGGDGGGGGRQWRAAVSVVVIFIYQLERGPGPRGGQTAGWGRLGTLTVNTGECSE